MLCCAPGLLRAQNAQESNAPAGDELKIMRQMLEQQSGQIDVLAQEIARLNLLLEGRAPAAGGPTAPAAEAATQEPAPADAAPAPAEATAVAGAPAAPTGPVHIVTKGETLTAIARHYKVTVPELLKVNKITDVRRLQIGQTLVLPPGAKISATPTPTPQ